jgi:hypothetical protein
MPETTNGVEIDVTKMTVAELLQLLAKSSAVTPAPDPIPTAAIVELNEKLNAVLTAIQAFTVASQGEDAAALMPKIIEQGVAVAAAQAEIGVLRTEMQALNARLVGLAELLAANTAELHAERTTPIETVVLHKFDGGSTLALKHAGGTDSKVTHAGKVDGAFALSGKVDGANALSGTLTVNSAPAPAATS